MRIGIVSHLYPCKHEPISGIYVKEELESISGYVDLVVIAPLPNQHWFGEIHKFVESYGYYVFRPFVVAFPRWFMQPYYPASMAYTLKRHSNLFDGCSLIHVHTAFPDGVAAVNTFAKRFPVIVTVHGSDINYFAMKPGLSNAITGSLNRASHIICVSKALEQKIKKLGVSTKTSVIPNGIDTKIFSGGSKENACRKLGLNMSRKRILYAGNFVPVKGVEYCIKALPKILKEYPDIELILLGAKPGTKDKIRYLHVINKAGVGDSVYIHDRVPKEQLPQWFHASDIVVMPSLHEGFGLVAAEALACGRPVVATRSGGPEDIIEDGLGLLVPPRDSSALGDAVIRVLSGKNISGPDKLSDSARRRFSYDGIAQQIVKVYNNTISKSN
ncbi:MAG: glycosyltransferase family 4 protein [Candidatus Latescibacteria bacterium]|nr:glycosyltransferase family 4 protein [Candidatus Latescibacterota bacterium]